jgi:hypothetical protein
MAGGRPLDCDDLGRLLELQTPQHVCVPMGAVDCEHAVSYCVTKRVVQTYMVRSAHILNPHPLDNADRQCML